MSIKYIKLIVRYPNVGVLYAARGMVNELVLKISTRKQCFCRHRTYYRCIARWCVTPVPHDARGPRLNFKYRLKFFVPFSGSILLTNEKSRRERLQVLRRFTLLVLTSCQGFLWITHRNGDATWKFVSPFSAPHIPRVNFNNEENNSKLKKYGSLFGFPGSELDDAPEFRFGSVGPDRNHDLRGLIPMPNV